MSNYRNNNDGYIYVYLLQIPQLVKIGISADHKKRISEHKADNYYGINPLFGNNGEIKYFCFEIRNYKKIEALIKKILNNIGRSEIYQISAEDAYAMLYYFGGKENFNNTGIKISKEIISTDKNIDELSYPKQMKLYAAELLRLGGGKDLEKLDFIYSEDEVKNFSVSRKYRTSKLGENIYIHTNYSANDSIRYIQQLIMLISKYND